jgi:hypothetical protein
MTRRFVGYANGNFGIDTLSVLRRWPPQAGHMLFDFTEAERNTARRALEIYVSELIDEIGKTERREWRESLRLEREILGRVIEQLSV